MWDRRLFPEAFDPRYIALREPFKKRLYYNSKPNGSCIEINVSISPQFFTYYNNGAVVACAKLWHHRLARIKVTSKRVFSSLRYVCMNAPTSITKQRQSNANNTRWGDGHEWLNVYISSSSEQMSSNGMIPQSSIESSETYVFKITLQLWILKWGASKGPIRVHFRPITIFIVIVIIIMIVITITPLGVSLSFTMDIKTLIQ